MRYGIVLVLLCGGAFTLRAQGTGFTYQGRLTFDGTPANGSYDLRFIPYNARDGGSQAGPILTNSATAVGDGFFTILLDFGQVNFQGTNYWLEIAVRTNNGGGGFVSLSPRQPITPAPQAMTSTTALAALGLAGVVANNSSAGEFATVGGGFGNTNHGYAGTIGGGLMNTVGHDYGTIGGGYLNSTSEEYATVAGGEGNVGSRDYATVSGGYYNLSSGVCASVGGGYLNTNSGYAATIAGGYQNSATESYAVVAGGYRNVASEYHAAVGGGDWNAATNNAATVAGGFSNIAGGDYATVGGGNRNWSTNQYATVPGGYGNIAGGQYSLAAGRNARAPGLGSFVWNSYSKANLLLGDHQFQVFAPHGFSVDYSNQRPDGGGERWLYIGDNIGGNTVTTWNGAGLTDAGVWYNASDKHRKTDFHDVDSREILERLAALPIRQWRYTNESPGVKHLGPTAQDFQHAFGLGTDDRAIGTVDADGVALAAIQGLDQKLNHEARRRDAENTDLKRQLDALQQLVNSLKQQLNGGAR